MILQRPCLTPIITSSLKHCRHSKNILHDMTLSCSLNTTSCTYIISISQLFCNISIEMLKHENHEAPVKESKRVNETLKFGACCASSSYVTLLITVCSTATKEKKTLQVSWLKTLQLISVYIIISLIHPPTHTHTRTHTSQESQAGRGPPVISGHLLQSEGYLGLYTEHYDRV